MTPTASLRLEDFIQAVQSQLDNAQAAMAVKARNANLPLTFAIKDINLDLRAHVEFADSEIRIRPASAGEVEASLFHLVFTTIPRPAIEENARSFADDSDDDSLDHVAELSHEDRKRLEWAGVRTVKQLQQAEEHNRVGALNRVTNLPLDRLRAALTRVSAPEVRRVEPVGADEPGINPAGPPLLRVIGRNLVRQGVLPRVQISGRPVAILKSSADELLVAPDHQQWAGELSIAPGPQHATAMSFDLSAYAPAPVAAPGEVAAPPFVDAKLGVEVLQ